MSPADGRGPSDRTALRAAGAAKRDAEAKVAEKRDLADKARKRLDRIAAKKSAAWEKAKAEARRKNLTQPMVFLLDGAVVRIECSTGHQLADLEQEAREATQDLATCEANLEDAERAARETSAAPKQAIQALFAAASDDWARQESAALDKAILSRTMMTAFASLNFSRHGEFIGAAAKRALAFDSYAERAARQFVAGKSPEELAVRALRRWMDRLENDPDAQLELAPEDRDRVSAPAAAVLGLPL